MANKRFPLRSLTAEELLELQHLLRAEKTAASVFRRCRLIWLLAAGYNLAQASVITGLHYTNAHAWAKRFQSEGLPRLLGRPRPGRPRLYDRKTETLVIEAATSRPPDLGLPFTTWSLIKLERYLRAQEEVLSRETIRRILHRHGLRFLTGRSWCWSTDPDYEVKTTP